MLTRLFLWGISGIVCFSLGGATRFEAADKIAVYRVKVFLFELF